MNGSGALAFGKGSSIVVRKCQVCDSPNLERVLFLGYLPPVNAFNPIGEMPHEQSSYPAQLLYCNRCHLVQLGLVVDPQIIFPRSYPYTSSTTKILRDNFAELYQECRTIVDIGTDDLVVDIGSNDGNLLSNFKDNHRVLGITPEKIGKIAIARGIPTLMEYYTKRVAEKVRAKYGTAKVVTATNVFAHMENINEITQSIFDLLKDDGVFISESHYLFSLIETLQYDTIYHEHLRHYSLHSLKFLLERHGFEVIHAKQIPTHGGSIRVYAAKKGAYPVRKTVAALLKKEKRTVEKKGLVEFKKRVVMSKLELHALMLSVKRQGKRIYGISAPSRASTLINYVGIDDGIVDCIVEVSGSHKIGKYVPGTLIPVLEESKLFKDQPEYALLFSWHIAEELMPKLRKAGFKGKFIIPLPKPHIADPKG